MKKLLIIFAAGILGMVACNDKVELKNDESGVSALKQNSEDYFVLGYLDGNDVSLAFSNETLGQILTQKALEEGFVSAEIVDQFITLDNEDDSYYYFMNFNVTHQNGSITTSRSRTPLILLGNELVDFEDYIASAPIGASGAGGKKPKIECLSQNCGAGCLPSKEECTPCQSTGNNNSCWKKASGGGGVDIDWGKVGVFIGGLLKGII